MSTYIAIDLKSYYASAECVLRGLDPLTTNLVVADPTRTEKTICLAVSPSLKAYGISGRARLFEVVQRVKEINIDRLNAAIRSGALRATTTEGERPHLGLASYDAPTLAADPTREVTYLVAPPQMRYYEETSAKIYNLYLKHIAPEDILVYSIDEVFIDVTSYLGTLRMTAHELAMLLVKEVLAATGITATAGIGTNLYLAKVAMDISAKHQTADADGVRIAELTEQTFREQLWDHRPLTAFWMTGAGTARHLERLGITTMGELARFSLSRQEDLYREFGIDAELMIDHAWGLEPCGMKEIKAHKPGSKSITEGQVLSCPYEWSKARIIVSEMVDSLVLQLVDKKLVCSGIVLDIGYDRENCDNGTYRGPVHIDHYGRSVPKPAHGTARLDETNLGSRILEATLALYDRISDRSLTVRRINIAAIRVHEDDGFYQMDLFTDVAAMEKEKRLQNALLGIKKKYGKNALLKGTNFEEGATMRERNGQIGGHRA